MTWIHVDEYILNLDQIVSICREDISKDWTKPYRVNFITNDVTFTYYEYFKTLEERDKYFVNLISKLVQ